MKESKQISLELLQALVNYLGKQPFVEVAKLIDGIQSELRAQAPNVVDLDEQKKGNEQNMKTTWSGPIQSQNGWEWVNESGAQIFYAQVSGGVLQIGAGATDGSQVALSINSSGQLALGGASPAAPSTGWAVTNVTPDKVYDANATTTDELADVLGTLITDLIAKGIISA